MAAALGPEVRRSTWWAGNLNPSVVAPLHLRLLREGLAQPTVSGFRLIGAAFREAVLQRARLQGIAGAVHRACAQARLADGVDLGPVADHLADAGAFEAALGALPEAGDTSRQWIDAVGTFDTTPVPPGGWR